MLTTGRGDDHDRHRDGAYCKGNLDGYARETEAAHVGTFWVMG